MATLRAQSHMNLDAVNQNSPKFRICGVGWGCPVFIELLGHGMTEVADNCLSLPCDNGAEIAIAWLIWRLVVPGPAMWRPRSARVGLSFIARQADKSAQIRGERGRG